jgi:hypothetical protein
VNGNILNSKGIHVGVVIGNEVFGLKGQRLYDLKGFEHLQVEWRPSRSFVECTRRGEAFGQSDGQAVSVNLICRIFNETIPLAGR